MITVNEGHVKFKGDIATLRAEFSVLCRNLRDAYAEHFGLEEADAFIEQDVKDSKKTEEELEKNCMDLLLKIIKEKLEEKHNG